MKDIICCSNACLVSTISSVGSESLSVSASNRHWKSCNEVPTRVSITTTLLVPHFRMKAADSCVRNIQRSGRWFSSLVQATKEQNYVHLKYSNGNTSRIHLKYLRDHCPCPKCRHPTTKQRLIDTASITTNSNDIAFKISTTANKLSIQWNESHSPGVNCCTRSEFSTDWLLNNTRDTMRKRLWGGAGNELQHIPKVSYNEFMNDIEAEKSALKQLYEIGLLAVTDMPSSMDKTEAFAKQRLGGYIMQTLYGQMWTTRPETLEESYNDTASTNDELLPHTDCTYMREPPGLQLFNCISSGVEGGDTRYVDGFQVMNLLSQSAKEYFESTTLEFECHDEGIELKSRALVFDKHSLVFRHNDYDRASQSELDIQWTLPNRLQTAPKESFPSTLRT